MWSHLDHPNLLSFYGIYQVEERLGCVCLVSPWMENGNINEYLETYPDVPRLPLVGLCTDTYWLAKWDLMVDRFLAFWLVYDICTNDLSFTVT